MIGRASTNDAIQMMMTSFLAWYSVHV